MVSSHLRPEAGGELRRLPDRSLPAPIYTGFAFSMVPGYLSLSANVRGLRSPALQRTFPRPTVISIVWAVKPRESLKLTHADLVCPSSVIYIPHPVESPSSLHIFALLKAPAKTVKKDGSGILPSFLKSETGSCGESLLLLPSRTRRRIPVPGGAPFCARGMMTCRPRQFETFSHVCVCVRVCPRVTVRVCLRVGGCVFVWPRGGGERYL